MFVDRVRVNLRAGNGGAGVVSFLRAKGKPKGKPTGGNGGPGGSVILKADPSVATLLRYQRNPHHTAEHGTHGEGDLRHGRTGESLVLSVPLGTVVIDDSGTMVADLVEAGQEVEAVKGGRGGRGNAAFVNPSNRAPGVAEQGEYGREEWLTLEMKLLADAALIGFPERGQIDLHLEGVGGEAEDRRLSVHDSGAQSGCGQLRWAGVRPGRHPWPHRRRGLGKGLGHEFLRHVERARVLVILLDPAPTQERAPADQLADSEAGDRRLLIRDRIPAECRPDQQV